MTIHPGEVFSRERLTETNKAITDRLGNEGYAFANVNAAPELDKEKRTVSFTIFVDPGRRVYVRRINVGGNTKTRDEVVRREMRQMEGHGTTARRSIVHAPGSRRLGYFDEVNVGDARRTQHHRSGRPEFFGQGRATGNLTLGAGFRAPENVVLSAAIAQQNLFGSGNSASLQINTSSTNRTTALSFTNPYFTPDG